MGVLPGRLTTPSAEVRDGRQSPAAFDICRGVARLLKAHGLAAVSEVALANGRRADVAGLSDSGEIWIVEIKSCLEDFRADQKWPEYREFCDRLFFAVAPDFPREVLPEDDRASSSPTAMAATSCGRRPSTGSPARGARR